jgi:hypothetical protein
LEIKMFTITHLFPSRANLEGFFPINDCGFVGLTGFFRASEWYSACKEPVEVKRTRSQLKEKAHG